MIQVWTIDENGFLIETKLIKESEKTDQDITTGFSIGFYKAKWNGTKWIEGATEEEIQAWQEENKIIKQPTTEEEMLKQIADLKIDNMKKDTIINNTLKTIAELKVQVMELKGGN